MSGRTCGSSKLSTPADKRSGDNELSSRWNSGSQSQSLESFALVRAYEKLYEGTDFGWYQDAEGSTEAKLMCIARFCSVDTADWRPKRYGESQKELAARQYAPSKARLLAALETRYDVCRLQVSELKRTPSECTAERPAKVQAERVAKTEAKIEIKEEKKKEERAKTRGGRRRNRRGPIAEE